MRHIIIFILLFIACDSFAQINAKQIKGATPKDSLWVMGTDTVLLSPTYGLGKWYLLDSIVRAIVGDISGDSDNDPTNEAWVISDGTTGELITTQEVIFEGTGSVTTSYDIGTNTMTIDGSGGGGANYFNDDLISDGDHTHDGGGNDIEVDSVLNEAHYQAWEGSYLRKIQGNEFTHDTVGFNLKMDHDDRYYLYTDGYGYTSDFYLDSNIVLIENFELDGLDEHTNYFILGGGNGAELYSGLDRLRLIQEQGNYYIGEPTFHPASVLPSVDYDYVIGYDETTGQLSKQEAGGGGSITADNGLTMSTGTNVQLGSDNDSGSPLLHETFINADSYDINISGTHPAYNLIVHNTGSGNAIYTTSDNNWGLYSTTINGGGVSGNSTNFLGLEAVSENYLAAEFTITPASTNTVDPAFRINRGSGGVVANGMGFSIDLNMTSSASLSRLANQLISKWIDVTDESRTSEFSITGVNNATTQDLLTLAGTGQLTLDQYTTSNFNGGVAADSVLVVTSAGVVKKRDAGAFVTGGGSDDQNLSIEDSGPTYDIAIDNGTDVTIAGAGGITLSESPANTLVITQGAEVDGSTTNEIQTLDASGTSQPITFDLSSDATDITLTGAGISTVSASGNVITVTSTEVDGSTSNEIQTLDASGTGPTITLDLSSDASDPTLTGAGIVAIAASGNTITVTGTEVDGSTSNELQTLSASGTTTSYGIDLSGGGGSVNLIEGSNITIDRTGDDLTINASGGSGSTDLTIGGSGPTYTIESSSGTDVTIQAAGINTLSESPANTLIITGTEVDGSTTNEIQTQDATGTTTVTWDLSGDASDISLTGAGIADVSRSGNAVTVTATEVDGSTTNELQTLDVSGTTQPITYSFSGDATDISITGSGIADITASGNVITVDATEVDGSITNEIQTQDASGTTTVTWDLSGDATDITLTGAGISAVSRSGNAVTVTSTEVDGSTTNELTVVKVDDAAVSAGKPTLDFASADFGVAESPTDEFQLTVQPERIQDIVGAMLTGNTETDITVTYQDGDGTIDFVVTGGGADGNGMWTASNSGTEIALDDFHALVPAELSFGTPDVGTHADAYDLHIDADANRIGLGTQTPSNSLSVTPIQYNTGTASQSTTTVTGSGTTWTAAMEGSQFVFVNGVSAGTIITRNSNTSLTVSTSQTVTSQAYDITYTGLQVDATGMVGVNTTSPVAALDVNGGVKIKFESSSLTSQTAAYSQYGITTTNAGTKQITLPVIDVAGRQFYFANSAGLALTVNAGSGNTIQGGATSTTATVLVGEGIRLTAITTTIWDVLN